MIRRRVGRPPPAAAPALLLGLALLGAPVASAAQAVPELKVTAIECPDLDAAEIQRLVELELVATPGMGDEVPPAQIELLCTSTSVTIAIRDPDWTVHIERQVPPPTGAEGGWERQLAITIAQFAAALWRAPERAGPPQSPPGPPAEPAPAAPATPAISAGYTPVHRGHQRFGVEARGELCFRALERPAPLATGRAVLAGTGWIDERIGVGAQLAFEGGLADRAGGEVAGFGAFGGLGLVYRLLAPRAWFSLDVLARLEGGYVWIDGRPEDDGYVGRRARGFGGGAGVGLAPTLHIGYLALALAAEGGYGIPAVVATVRGDDSVSFGGWWAGIGLRIGAEI